jgi:hypothetical protein
MSLRKGFRDRNEAFIPAISFSDFRFLPSGVC